MGFFVTFIPLISLYIMTRHDLNPGEYNPYYGTYISKTGELTLKNDLKSAGNNIISFLEGLPEEKLEFRYADGKWTIKEIIQHMMDTERVFSYRALRIARRDKTPLPGLNKTIMSFQVKQIKGLLKI